VPGTAWHDDFSDPPRQWLQLLCDDCVPTVTKAVVQRTASAKTFVLFARTTAMRSVARLNAGITLLICLAFMGSMGLQLYTQAQLRGILSGVRVQTQYVTQKWIQKSDKWGRADTYWVSWTSKDIHQPGNHRVNMQADTWAKLHIGSPITLAYAGIDNTPYIRNDIFDSNGNITAHMLVFFVALAVSMWMLVVLFAAQTKPTPMPSWQQ
jgi:hypothetical protein